MAFERMLDDSHQPTNAQILNTIRKKTAWIKLHKYIDENYDFIPETVFYGKKYGWTIRYRKSGKTLISLFPEHGAFTALVVLGKNELDKVLEIIEELSDSTRDLINKTERLHDGCWLWIRIHKVAEIKDIIRLLIVKRKPGKKNI